MKSGVIKEILMLLFLYVLCTSCSRTVKDVDGNVYHTVKIGKQVWMKENLRTTHYADGTEIASWEFAKTMAPWRYCPNEDYSNVNTFGYLYNWSAVMHAGAERNSSSGNVKGICPDGWHVPSKSEFDELVAYCEKLSERKKTYSTCSALAAPDGWEWTPTEYSPAKPKTDNASGFSAVPAGEAYYNDKSLHYDYFGRNANFWGIKSNEEMECILLELDYIGEYSYKSGNVTIREGIDKSESCGYSVRCVKD